jgi:glycosyltransferase involved in cell wall biosynthesis
VFVGDVPAGQEIHADYANRLRALADQLGVAERVTFTGGLLAPQVRDWYQRAAVAVNLSPPGLFDKAALESMATAVPTIVSSPAFDSLLGDHAPLLRLTSPDDLDGLADRLQTLLAMSPEQRARIGLVLRERVIAEHSLERLMPRLVRVFATGEPE